MEQPQRKHKSKGCRAFEGLKDFQVDQYRDAIHENKWYMGERLGREVPWEEAEKDFLHNDYYGCAPKWRKAYCKDQCTHFHTCALGKHFCRDG